MTARCTPFQITSTASTNLTQVSGGSGTAELAEMIAVNTATTARFIKFYWAPQGVIPVVGTTIPTLTVFVPALSTTAGQASINFSSPMSANGQLWVWMTVNPAATDTTATAAGDLIVTVGIRL